MEREGYTVTGNGISPATAYADAAEMPINKTMPARTGLGAGGGGNPLMDGGGSSRERHSKGKASGGDYSGSRSSSSNDSSMASGSSSGTKARRSRKPEEKSRHGHKSESHKSRVGSESSMSSQHAPSKAAYAQQGSEPDDRVLVVQIRSTLRQLMSKSKGGEGAVLEWSGKEVMSMLIKEGYTELTQVGGIHISKAANTFPMPFVVVYDVMHDTSSVMNGSVVHFFPGNAGVFSIEGMKSDDVYRYDMVPQIEQFGETWFTDLHRKRVKIAGEGKELAAYTVSNFMQLNVTKIGNEFETHDPMHPLLEYGRKVVEHSINSAYPRSNPQEFRERFDTMWASTVRELQDKGNRSSHFRISAPTATEWSSRIVEWDAACNRKLGDLKHTYVRLVPAVTSAKEAKGNFWDRYPDSLYFREYFPDVEGEAVDAILDRVFSFSCNITIQVPPNEGDK